MQMDKLARESSFPKTLRINSNDNNDSDGTYIF